MFPTTHWSLLAEATLQGDTHGRAALNELCRTYREPAVRFVQQRWGLKRMDAEDIAQSFFEHFLRERLWRIASPENKQKFRNLMLVALKNHAIGQFKRRNAGKRGGGCAHETLDGLIEHAEEPATLREEETARFDGEWAINLLRLALQRVEAKWAARARAEDYRILSGFLPGSTRVPSAEEAAPALGMTLEALRTAISRLRKELGHALREQIAATVAPDEVEEEMHYLQRVLSHREVF